MAITELPAPLLLQATGQWVAAANITLNAAAESTFIIGQVFFKARTGSKTISAGGGGSIFWLTGPGAITFANAGTTLRIGIQDVAVATGLPDGTFDVSADYVGGTDTLAASTIQETPMESGSKTIAYGDIIAFGVDMISRGGVDDVNLARIEMHNGLTGQKQTFPYGTTATPTPTKAATFIQCLLKFDDGTYGWIQPVPLLWDTNDSTPTGITYGSGSTPDEYAGIFSFDCDVRIDGIGASLGGIASGDDFELILYSDPLGTPAVIEAITVDPDIIGVTNTVPLFRLLSTPRDLTANTKYAIAARPTTVNTITWGHLSVPTGMDDVKSAQPYKTLQMGSRTDNTGAFSETNVLHIPLITLSIAGMGQVTAGSTEHSAAYV